MRILTVRQPVAYLAGVLKGDAWLSKRGSGVLGLRVADEDFAQTFAQAIREGFAVDVKCARDERGYWLVRKTNLHDGDRYADAIDRAVKVLEASR